MRIGQAHLFIDLLPAESAGWEDLLSGLIGRAIATAWPGLISENDTLASAERNLHYAGYCIINLALSLTVPDSSHLSRIETALGKMPALIFLDPEQVGMSSTINAALPAFCSVMILTGKR